MKPYHKIHSLFKRQSEKPHKFILGEFSRDVFEFLQYCIWLWDEKVDGTNIRVIMEDGKVRFTGKTDRAQLHAKLVDALNEMFADKMGDVFSDCGMNVCLYGEGYGAGIQSGGNYRPDMSFVLFDVKIGDLWLERHNVADIADKLGIQKTPEVGRGNFAEAIEFVKSGYNSTWGDFPAEGIVLRPACELRDRRGDRIITKLKLRDFQ